MSEFFKLKSHKAKSLTSVLVKMLEIEGPQWVYCLLDSNHDNSSRQSEERRLILWLAPPETGKKKRNISWAEGFAKVGVDVAPTDVVHGDGGGLDVEASDLGWRVYQNPGDLGVIRECGDKSEPEVVDDGSRSIPAGIKCWCEASDSNGVFIPLENKSY